MESSRGTIGRRARDVESAHLLTGFARCGLCGGSFYPLSRDHGRKRVFYYGCSANHKRGRAVCGNGHVMPKQRIDAAVLLEIQRAITGDVLRPAVIEAVLDGVFAAMAPDAVQPATERARQDLATVDREIE